MKINPFEHYEPYKVTAELMKFAFTLINKVKGIKSNLGYLLKDLGIDCAHITGEMKDNNIIKCWIGVNTNGYTRSIYITRDNKWSSSWYRPEKDDGFIWITCIEFKRNWGHGCKWIEVNPEDIVKELEEHYKNKNKKE